MTFSEVITLAQQGTIKRIVVQGDTLVVTRTDTNVDAKVQTDANANLIQTLQAAGVTSSQLSKIDISYSFIEMPLPVKLPSANES